MNCCFLSLVAFGFCFGGVSGRGFELVYHSLAPAFAGDSPPDRPCSNSHVTSAYQCFIGFSAVAQPYTFLPLGLQITLSTVVMAHLPEPYLFAKRHDPFVAPFSSLSLIGCFAVLSNREPRYGHCGPSCDPLRDRRFHFEITLYSLVSSCSL